MECTSEGGVEAGPGHGRVVLEPARLAELPVPELLQLWAEQDRYIDQVEERARLLETATRGEASRREQLLVMRLTAKEQELQEFAAQIAELKAAQAPSTAQLRATLLDPAVNLVIQRLTKECDQQKKAAEEAQNELAAWKFTPDSATGKRLMAKCRQLYQENEDLGKMIASGRLAKLEGELALQKNLTEEMKKNQQEMDEFMSELDEDVEGMQSTICYLQQQLREARDTIGKLEQQLGNSSAGRQDTQHSSNAEPDNRTKVLFSTLNTSDTTEQDVEEEKDEETGGGKRGKRGAAAPARAGKRTRQGGSESEGGEGN